MRERVSQASDTLPYLKSQRKRGRDREGLKPSVAGELQEGKAVPGSRLWAGEETREKAAADPEAAGT